MIRLVDKLKLMADKLRLHSIKETTVAGSGHPTSCMSCAEVMSVLFFSELKNKDEFILSKGHAAPILWAAYAEAGLIPLSKLKTLRKIDSSLEGHPTPEVPLIKVATGSLGQGLSAGVGMALGQRLSKNKGRVFVLLGDGECAEGSVWEAANCASYYSLNNLCAVVDVNRLGQSQQTMHGHDLKAYEAKFKAFGWRTLVVDGHDVKKLKSAFSKLGKSKKPLAILAKTFKGHGLSLVENKLGWHGKPFKGGVFDKAVEMLDCSNVKLKSKVCRNSVKHSFKNYSCNKYKLGEMVSTRQAFGTAFVALGKANKTVVTVDGDVRNSTMTQAFFDNFPKRSFESFIAEQNMAGASLGLSKVGYVPFVATFAAFWTRAHDFIRMAAYSEANVKFVGSHAGVSIGEDGASQMGLEDLSMFLSVPGALVLYPSDAVSTEHLVKELGKHKGVSYLRTTRGKTPVVYPNNEKFPIGGLKVLRKSKRDKVLVIGAGETLHEALNAYDLLKAKGVDVRVIDLYSVQPVDRKALLKNAKECKGRVVVVEDHYFGGIGSVVMSVVGKIEHLYVKKIPRSGKPEQLRKMFGIDSSAIVRAVKRLVR